jgi:hypothetical protein
VKIVEALPHTNFEQPTSAELRELARLVWAAHPWLPICGEAEFGRAFYATGFMWRLPEPSPRFFFHSYVDDCCNFLARLGLDEVEGPAVMGAILGHADIKYRLADSSVGQLLEVGLSANGPGAKCRNAWRRVLETGELLPPLPPRGVIQSIGEQAIPVPRILKAGPDGAFREIGPNEDLWSSRV